ncbi:MAG: hypothetical protein NTW06_02770 [Candidatus Falkowbacteria bacterium]|nr:hypothetical protein [Candidatus Falkowbacteria bacterium]
MLWPIILLFLFIVIVWDSRRERKAYFTFFCEAMAVVLFGVFIALAIGYFSPKIPATIESRELVPLLGPTKQTCPKQIFALPLEIYGENYITLRFGTDPPSKTTAMPSKDLVLKKSKTNIAYLSTKVLIFKKPWYYLFAINPSTEQKNELYIPEGGIAQ